MGFFIWSVRGGEFFQHRIMNDQNLVFGLAVTAVLVLLMYLSSDQTDDSDEKGRPEQGKEEKNVTQELHFHTEEPPDVETVEKLDGSDSEESDEPDTGDLVQNSNDENESNSDGETE